MWRSRWLGHPLTLVVAGAVALAAGAAIAPAAARIVEPPAVGATPLGLDHTVTAAITRETRITGLSRRAVAIKVGDSVSAQIEEAQINEAGSPTVLDIQDPASVP